MVLKMDNTYASSPQVGLGEADMVVEELVEGGSTRLAAFYYSQIPGDVGPVRSMRASDIGIVSPVKGAMVTSGAAMVTINRIEGADIPFFSEGDKGFYRDSSRSAPYNLFTDMSETATLVDQDELRAPGRLPAVGRRGRLPAGAAGRHPGRELLGRAHHQLAVRGRHLRQREHLRRCRRRVPGRHRAGAARAGR